MLLARWWQQLIPWSIKYGAHLYVIKLAYVTWTPPHMNHQSFCSKSCAIRGWLIIWIYHLIQVLSKLLNGPNLYIQASVKMDPSPWAPLGMRHSIISSIFKKCKAKEFWYPGRARGLSSLDPTRIAVDNLGLIWIGYGSSIFSFQPDRLFGLGQNWPDPLLTHFPSSLYFISLIFCVFPPFPPFLRRHVRRAWSLNLFSIENWNSAFKETLN